MQNNLPKITIGPIIGKVDENSARILIEIDQEIELTINLKEIEEIEEQSTFSITNLCTPKYPKVFKFIGLKPYTRYEVIIENKLDYLNPELKELKSKFRTTSANDGISPDKFNLGFISCNSSNYYKNLENPEFSLWENLSQKVKSEDINYLIHMGDQIYLDDGFWNGEKNNCFSKAFELWNEAYKRSYGKEYGKERKNSKNSDLNKEYNSKKIDENFKKEKVILEKEIIEIISNEYREAWNIKPCADALRNSPNLMILDDHEIYDDFGFDGKYDPNDMEIFENFFADKARFCYYKYQKQLADDVDFESYPIAEKEHHSHIINGVGLFVQDFRGCFTWLKDYNYKGTKGKLDDFFGKSQSEEIKNCFGKGGKFEKTKFAFYISANPLVFFSSMVTNLAKEKVNDCYEHWAFAARNEQAELLDILVDFKKNNKIETMLISGDVHIGCYTSIFKDDEYILKQMITSPISQKPPTNFEMKVMNLLRFSQNELANGYVFVHSTGINECNYGLVELRLSLMGEKYNANAKHIKSNGKRFEEDDVEDINTVYKKPCCTNCQII